MGELERARNRALQQVAGSSAHDLAIDQSLDQATGFEAIERRRPRVALALAFALALALTLARRRCLLPLAAVLLSARQIEQRARLLAGEGRPAFGMLREPRV